MKKPLVALGLAGAAVLTLGGASVFAMAQGFGPGTGSGSNGYAAVPAIHNSQAIQNPQAIQNSQESQDPQAMHNSPAMQQAMAQLSPQLRAQCNAMHAQMSSHMNGATGSGMMGGR